VPYLAPRPWNRHASEARRRFPPGVPRNLRWVCGNRLARGASAYSVRFAALPLPGCQHSVSVQRGVPRRGRRPRSFSSSNSQRNLDSNPGRRPSSNSGLPLGSSWSHHKDFLPSNYPINRWTSMGLPVVGEV
jgi:hypothetical protein